MNAPIARRIRVRGSVQGVGFRPHVWRLASELGLVGRVANDGRGVIVELWGDRTALDLFSRRLVEEAPPLARIEAVETSAGDGPAPADFTISASVAGSVDTGVVPDAATCPACRAELFAPGDRRRGYAFGNCTHCGPRLSIIRRIPYDRAATAMSAFPMCPECAREYADPADRRFHAEPTACPTCGPRLWLEPVDRDLGGDPIDAVVDLLRAGRIVAIKGIGGFHLACDATNPIAVDELRRRKRRDAKPFALMARSVAEIARYCRVDETARALLTSPAAPIVLLPRSAGGAALPARIAPDQDHLGFMLPYAPVHHLIAAGLDGPLVMTSGNRSDEPQVTDNAEARTRLAGIADAWLSHDREIVNRLDDSVVAPSSVGPTIIRRARGYAPASLSLHPDFRDLPPTLAMGGELKATFCLLRNGRAIPSQHIGDLEDAAALADYRTALDLFRRLFDFTPEVIAVDAHPDYLSTRLGEELAEACGARLTRVAHHHAHMASCLADAGLGPDEGGEDAFGLILDGLGMGTDGALWGGELLRDGFGAGARVGHIAAAALPGGAAAMREPRRNLLAHLRLAFGADWRSAAGPALGRLPDETTLGLWERMIGSGVNAPPCSSAGRLFDAVAAALGLHPDRIDHEGQAALALEALARPNVGTETAYPTEIANGVVGWTPMWERLLADLSRDADPGVIAARFHLGFVAAMTELALWAGRDVRSPIVALSGGVVQNRIVLEGLVAGLRAGGARPVVHLRVPPNDGGLSLGQAILGATDRRPPRLPTA